MVEPAAPGTEDEFQPPQTSKEETEEERLLALKAYLDDGSYGPVFEVSSINGKEYWYCNLCRCPVMGNIPSHETGKQHSTRLTWCKCKITGQSDNNSSQTSTNEDCNEEKTSAVVEITPGEPLPPGFEKQPWQVAMIQERLNTYKGGVLVGLEYVLELQDIYESESKYLCVLCNKMGDPNIILIHVESCKHVYKYLQRHFPTVCQALAPYKTKQNKPNWQPCIAKIAEAIERRFGRLRPMPVEADKFEKNRTFYIEQVAQSEHFQESPTLTFVELVNEDELTKTDDDDVEKKDTTQPQVGKCDLLPPVVQNYTNGQPKQPPSASGDIQGAELNPSTQYSQQNQQGQKQENLVLHRGRWLSPAYSVSSSELSNPLEPDKRGNMDRLDTPVQVAPIKFGYGGYSQPVKAKTDMNSSVTQGSLYPIPHRPLYPIPHRPLYPKSCADSNPDNKDDSWKYQRSCSTARPSGNEEPASKLRKMTEMDRSPWGMVESHKRESVGRASAERSMPYQQGGRPTQPWEEDNSSINIMSVLRLLTAFEEKLGSLGPKVNNLLAQALVMEKAEANSSEKLLDKEINCVLLETAKEKLKGQILAGLANNIQEPAYKRAIKKTESLIHLVSTRKAETSLNTKPDPINVPDVGTVDKAAIARQVAAMLVMQGKTGVTQQKLEPLMNVMLNMAEGSQDLDKLLTTADFLNRVNEAQKQKALEAQKKKQKEDNRKSAMDTLTLIANLLSNVSKPTSSSPFTSQTPISAADFRKTLSSLLNNPGVDKPDPGFDGPAPTFYRPPPAFSTPHLAFDRPVPGLDKPGPGFGGPAPAFGGPVPAFNRPAPTFDRPAPTFDRPAPTFDRPAPTFDRPAPTFDRPAPTFDRPTSAFNGPASAFNGPASAFNRPASAFNGPASAFNGPAPAYYRPPPSFSTPAPSFGTPAAAIDRPGVGICRSAPGVHKQGPGFDSLGFDRPGPGPEKPNDRSASEFGRPGSALYPPKNDQMDLEKSSKEYLFAIHGPW